MRSLYKHLNLPLCVGVDPFPPPLLVMDIKEIVNSKGVKVSAAVAAAHSAQDLHLLQSLSQSTNMGPMSDTGSERGTSPHGSEHSRYSIPRYNHLGGNGVLNEMRYPSPTAMQSPLPMLQQPYRHENNFNSGMMQQDNIQPPRPAEQQKAFPCSTCGKGFARRSDLARHGMFILHLPSIVYRLTRI